MDLEQFIFDVHGRLKLLRQQIVYARDYESAKIKIDAMVKNDAEVHFVSLA